MRDFTLDIYKLLLNELQESDYHFYSFEGYLKIENHADKFLILRHDVDKKPGNALYMAAIERSMNIKASYYFRVQNEILYENEIKEIVNLEHEIGYHYENLAEINRRQKIEGRRQKEKTENKRKLEDIYELAIMDFEKNLEKLRKIYPVKTICMHGSPLSKWDSKRLWEKYNYRDFGIIGEPNFDIDFNEVLYLTDTGRRWDGSSFNVRDKVDEKIKDRRQKKEVIKSEARNTKFETKIIKQEKGERRQESEAGGKELKINISNSMKNSFHSTFDIIKAAEEDRLPDKIMLNIHPQRWNDSLIPWMWELVSQNVKNVVKKYFYVRDKRK